ncbi:hypothetical protein GCM10009682_34200 [Luedemannella flava]|uniref:DUF1877 family protein n=1 Tax=Luedemannella flava TaxID=349316 RepID=A0ABN2M4X7_9ACTN
MSAIAQLYLVPRDLLVAEQLPVHVVATKFGRRIDPDAFPYSGYLMLDVLTFLGERDIPIDSTELPYRTDPDGPYDTVITTEHRALLPQLDPAGYPLGEIREFMDQYDELDDDELQGAFTDTLNLLRTTIADLADDEALVVLIW